MEKMHSIIQKNENSAFQRFLLRPELDPFFALRFWWGNLFYSQIFSLDFYDVILVNFFPLDFGEVIFFTQIISLWILMT